MTEPQIDIEKLDIEQRLRLIERLWDSLSGDPQALPLTAEQEAELGRRLDEMESGDTEGIPWEEVMKRIRTRLG